MICIPVFKKRICAVVKATKKAQKHADIVEIWPDELPKFDQERFDRIKEVNKKPLLYKFQGNEENLELLMKNKIEYIDLDINTKDSLVKKVKNLSKKTKLILSHHDFKKTPIKKEIQKIINGMLKKGADIVKIATTAKSFSDTTMMLELLSEVSCKHKVIIICMGKEGTLTRTTGHLCGNYLMYAALDEKSKTAPGQIMAEDLKEIQTLISKVCH